MRDMRRAPWAATLLVVGYVVVLAATSSAATVPVAKPLPPEVFASLVPVDLLRAPTPLPDPSATPRPSASPTPRPAPRPTPKWTPPPTPRWTPRPTLRPTFRPTPRPTPRPTITIIGTPSLRTAKTWALSQIGQTQYGCLDLLWTRESNWNPYARNTTSGAYGIPQALPGWKMASAGADWATNPLTQVRWGLGYIASSYGTACNAWAHSQQYGWY